ncbi:glycosyl transferase family 2 [Spirochaetia bacterium]|nr:glycosyl transferase family 2 [Spirochaetia bacterium]
MITASISITNTLKEQLYRLLECIKMTNIDFVYVIDNSYNDHYRIIEKEFNNVRYIYSENLGYGANHNIALREAIDVESDFHIILNPDIYFDSDVVPSLLQYMNENIDTVYILPKVLYPDGEIQYLCKLLPTPFDLFARRFLPDKLIFRKIKDKYCLKSFGYDKEINPPCLSGCFMFLRMSAIKEHKIFFNEQYFLYCEDFDFIRRLHRIGKTVYYPKVSITHDHAKESYKSRKWLFVHIKSAITYFNKWGWFFDTERKKINKQILNELKEL